MVVDLPRAHIGGGLYWSSSKWEGGEVLTDTGLTSAKRKINKDTESAAWDDTHNTQDDTHILG